MLLAPWPPALTEALLLSLLHPTQIRINNLPEGTQWTELKDFVRKVGEVIYANVNGDEGYVTSSSPSSSCLPQPVAATGRVISLGSPFPLFLRSA
jgi:hypothetical protein